MDIKKRLKNKVFVVALIALVIQTANMFGVAQYIPEEFVPWTNGIIALLVYLGVLIDPTTSGVSDGK